MRQFKRILDIHRHLSMRRRSRIAAPCTAEMLAERFEVNARTIRRDLHFMRDQLHLPLEFNAAGNAWSYSAAAAELPATLIGAEDRFALLVARQAAEQYRGTPWYDHLKGAFARILESLPDEKLTDYESVAAKIRFEGTPLPPVDPETWKTICNCLEASETLSMTYKTGRDGVVRTRRLDPYGLIVRNREWYVVGWDHSHGAFRTFFLPRIRRVDYTGESFLIREGFDLDSYLATAVDGHQSSTPSRVVVLRFTAAASAAGEDFIWNPQQKVSRDREGRLVVEFVTGALFAVRRYVLSWGGGVQVVKPKELRDAVLDDARAVLRSAGQRK